MGYALRPRDRRSLVPTAPGLATVEAVEVFAAGRHRGDPYPVQFLDKVVENFRRFTGESGKRVGVTVDPPVVLGHDDEQTILQNSGLPAAGVVWNLWRVGTKLFADLNDVPPQVADAIDRRAYRKVSAEFREDFQDQGRSFGPVMWRLALLGADQPQVKSLADLPQTKRFADVRRLRRVAELSPAVARRMALGRVICFSEVSPMDREQMMKAVKAKLPFLTPKFLDGLSDEQLAALLGDMMGAEAGDPAAAGGDPNAPAFADPPAAPPVAPPVAGLPGGAAPDPLAPVPTPPLVPPMVNPLQAPPAQITYKFAELERRQKAIEAKQEEADRLVSARLQREDDAQVSRFWDEELQAGKRAPWQEKARKAELKALDGGRTLKFDDAGERPMSQREYSHWVAMKSGNVLKFGEIMPADPHTAAQSQKAAMLGATAIGRAVMKEKAKVAAK